MIEEIDPHQTIRFVWTFKDFDGAPQDPTTIVFRLQAPHSGEVTEYAIGDFDHEVLEIGIYTIDHTFDIPGQWTFLCWGDNGGAKKGNVNVRQVTNELYAVV